MKKALVFGASGLVGSHLIKYLINNEDYSKIIVVNRRSLAYNSTKVQEIISTPDEFQVHRTGMQADIVFCALGTTIKKAGSISAFRKIDFDYVVNAAKLAKTLGIESFVVVSSIGTKKSANYYLQTKYEMEQALILLNFKQLAILRPSLLLGERSETRWMESFAAKIYPTFDVLLLGGMKKYRAIKAGTVAKAMIKIAENKELNGIFQSDKVEELGQ